MVDVLKGNTVALRVLVKDQSRAVVTNLATATQIRYMVKVNKTDLDATALISKVLADGILVDTPSTGYIRIPLSSADMNIAVGTYVQGLQLEWAGPVIQEAVLADESFVVVQDTILT